MKRNTLAAVFLVIAPVGLAVGILAAHTVGDALSQRDESVIGFAVALLAVATAAGLLLLYDPATPPVGKLGLTLVISGTACVLAAVALQFYLASVTAENTRRLAELVGEHIRAGRPTNFNVNANHPPSVQGIGYLALFAGVWLAAVGVRIGVGRAPPAPPPAIPGPG
jgi:hypothetical protein